MADGLIRNILVVEDEHDYRALMLQVLDKMGYSCLGASDADEAMEKIVQNHFDLVISDIRMKGKDGLQLTREALEAYPNLEFIIMTGHAADYSYSDIISAGAADFLSKPFEMGKLKAKIDRLQRERSILWQLKEANEALAREAAVSSTIAELSKALIRSLPVEEVTALVIDHARQLTESPVAYVAFVDRQTGRLVGTVGAAKDGTSPEEDGETVLGWRPSDFWKSVIGHGEPILVNEVRGDSRFSELARGGVDFRRFLAVPSSVGGTPLGFVALADAPRDYTEKDLALVSRLSDIYGLAIQRMWAHDELIQTKEYLENVLNNSAEAIGIVDARGKFVLWNKAATKVYGYELEEMRNQPAFSLYADQEELRKMLDQLRRDDFVRRYEISMRKKDGSTAPFELSLSVLRDKNQEVCGSVAVAMDLSDLKRAMTELKHTNDRLQQEIIERKGVEEELKKARDQLEVVLAERTAKLSRAGEVLKRSITRIKDITEQ
jgi:PAS domain S-box-containing protein